MSDNKLNLDEKMYEVAQLVATVVARVDALAEVTNRTADQIDTHIIECADRYREQSKIIIGVAVTVALALAGFIFNIIKTKIGL